ncbi:hypothetical protein [Rhodoferax sp. TS-BS-61-7]|uniref:hypothetical protein n=1 Tax=Rhodoferax sp. TS-BS-61-7 TaxID=2094194 RepID=UPI001374DF3C|nr:hypothetical protein [Rhodoferax sp. TS-BS-61-7]
MSGKHTQVRANRNEVAVSHTTTDSPLLPIEQIERLQAIAPHRVEWVFDQTQIESEARRKETRRINTMIFMERIAGLVFALVISLIGLGAATYLALSGSEVPASIIGGTTLVGIVTAFVAGKKSDTSKK